VARAQEYLSNPQNWADVVTISRLAIAPFCTLLLMLWPRVGIWVAMAFGLTDFVDGILARRFGSHWWGGTLDALVDKWFTVCIFAPLVHMDIFPWWACAILMLREGLATLVRYYGQQMDAAIRTSAFGKIKTNVLLWTCLVAGFDYIYAHGWGPALYMGGGFLGLVVTLVRHRRYLQTPRDGYIILPANLSLAVTPFVSFHNAVSIGMLTFSLGSFAEYLVVGYSAIRQGLRQVPLLRSLGLLAVASVPPAMFALFPGFRGQSWVVTLVTLAQCTSFLILLRYELWAAARQREAGRTVDD
jgi:phosphatidylglycerophosphate synthase